MASDPSSSAVIPRPHAPSKPEPSFSQKWKARIQRDPVVYGFLGLTVLALTRGLGALMSNDHALSQRMMRFRVLFQLSTVGALVGGIYYRAYTAGEGEDPFRGGAGKAARVDNRVYLHDPRVWDAAEEIAAVGAGPGSTTSHAAGAMHTQASAAATPLQ